MEKLITISNINRSIVEVCKSIDKTNNIGKWMEMRESDLIKEMIVCVAGSQMPYFMSIAIAERLESKNISCFMQGSESDETIRQLISLELALPITWEASDGRIVNSLPRFKNRIVELIIKTRKNIYGGGCTLMSILRSASSAKVARSNISLAVCGFGPKQASLFLRRIGYCNDFAVLDTHIIDYLKLATGNDYPKTFSTISSYEQVENVFKKQFYLNNENIGSLDLATWVTMRVAKKEVKKWQL
jgi:N-glycosylase/DNA lyase